MPGKGIMHKYLLISIILFIYIFSNGLMADSPLTPVKTDSPRDTMKTFIESMNDYRKLKSTDPESANDKLNRAVRTLDLEDIPFILREEKGNEAAKYLKEVIDRIILIDYSKIPERIDGSGQPVVRWRLKDTEITILQKSEGERSGEYLISSSTVYRAREFYDKVQHLDYLKGSGMGAGFEEPWLDRYIPPWATGKIFHLFVWQWIGMFAAVLLGLIVKTIVSFVFITLESLARNTHYTWDDRLLSLGKGPLDFIAGSTAWYFGVRMLRLEGDTLSVINFLVQSLFSIGFIWFAYRAVEEITKYFLKFAEKTESTLDDHLVPLLNRTLKIFTVIFGVLVAIQNMGVNVLSLVAGLGIGGIAFALAAKDTVANFFGSIMILFDSPFQVGDWIRIGSMEGTVEEIGFRSTRVRTFYNSQLTIPNSDLMNARIDNMGRREFRRIRAMISVTYDTSPDKMEAFLEGIKNIIKANPNTRKDYYHVVFNEFGPDSLVVMLYAFLKVPDWSSELVERQNIYIEILRLAKELNVDFAFPTQTLHVESFPEKESLRNIFDFELEEYKKRAAEFGPGGQNSSPEGRGIFTPPYKEN